MKDVRSTIHHMEEIIEGTLKVGASLAIGECILPKFLGTMMSKYPELKYEVIIGNTEEICQKVQSLEIDIGVVEGRVTSSEFIQEDFYEDEMVLVKKASHEKEAVVQGLG